MEDESKDSQLTTETEKTQKNIRTYNTRRVPAWIKNLSPGQYTTKQLKEITGLTKGCVTFTLKKYGAEVIKVPCKDRNLYIHIYIWSGYQERVINKNNTIRYKLQSSFLGALAFKQLNLEKNRIKPDFETMNLLDIYYKLVEEVNELKLELMDIKTLKEKENINYEKVSWEVGDCAAVLTGFIAKIDYKKD